MSKIDPNAPAFPIFNAKGEANHDSLGLSIRTKIAGEQMAAILGTDAKTRYAQLYMYDPKEAARLAVEATDALIAELNKGEGE